ncbi:MAG: hypothetical protein KIT45_02510 [Fimbriimonadia bacterium]|nr:hypothetical protein [Fimbriimonadia bacterium]
MKIVKFSDEEKVGNQWTSHAYGAGLIQRGDDFQHWDQMGSLAATSDGQGNRLAGPIFDSFGYLISGNLSEYGWNGLYSHRYEVNIGGILQVGVRWYDPVVGRFLQQDPAFSVPVYSYCWNDPVNLVDYFGFKPGDKYKSADAAAKAALRDIGKELKMMEVEFGGWIYENSDGTFSYTKPVKGTEFEVNPSQKSIPQMQRPLEVIKIMCLSTQR